MTLVQLHHFVCLARAGSFVKAAEQLFITQPALSRSIKALEEELGQLLFDRIGRRIELTRFGQEVMQRGQLLLEDAHELKQSARQLEQGATGRIRLGLSSGPGLLLTVPLLVHSATHFPRFHVDVVRAHTETLVRQLRDRQVDALIVDVRSLRPAPDLQVEELIEMPAAFLCRPGHPLARRRRLGWEALLAYPMASTPLSDEVARMLVEQYGQQAHPSSLVQLSSDELSHLKTVVASSNAILLAIRSAGPELVALDVVPALRSTARFGLVTVARRVQPPFLREVRALMRQHMQPTKP